MANSFVDSLTLVDTSGQLILATILALLTSSVGTTGIIRRRYAALEADLKEHTDPSQPFASRVLNLIVRDAQEATRRHGGEVNVQAIVEHRFQTELRGLIVGERFVKASTGLAIILGLVGTFYGLTSAIGKLVGLVAADTPAVGDLTQAITRGLTQALSGMSIAFSTSLCGIVAAITMTLVGVFLNLSDRRTAVMVQTEAYLDNQIEKTARPSGAPVGYDEGETQGPLPAGKLALVVDDFAETVARLERSVATFDAALEKFSTSTRDFREFNLHLKDNIQRMSLSFGDLSETLKAQVGALKSRVQS